MNNTFHMVADEADISSKTATAVVLNGWPVAVSKTKDGISAVLNRCSHAASELASGRVRNGTIMCPLHGARFEMTTGRCLGGAYLPLKTFETRIVDGKVEVAVPNVAPGPEHQPVTKPI